MWQVYHIGRAAIFPIFRRTFKVLWSARNPLVPGFSGAIKWDRECSGLIIVQLRTLVPMLALAALLPTAAGAAVVTPLGGEVRVSTGQGFRAINQPTEFAAGAQVMVSAEGRATIVYSADCVVPVSAASVAFVQPRAPCRSLPAPMHFGYEQYTPAAGDPLGFTPKVGPQKPPPAPTDAAWPTESYPLPPPPPPPPPEDSSNTTSEQSGASSSPGWGTILIIGGVAVGAGVLAGVLAGGGGDSDPVSP